MFFGNFSLSSLMYLEEIKLIVIDNWIFQVSDFLRLFLIYFKYCLASLKCSSIDIYFNVTFLFDINIAIKITCSDWSE